ncbi:NAD-dependent protein deacetylase [Commensalibacter communis]|uniref:NAD-dependent protein deacylase n=1 Tax=Commensalibacter communis TaxID=2972786 RepID=A0A9W4XHM0_9PROT|nr:NAD-dependent deacylase [Commensalibacter communis]CAI3935225.1 NAD-dependent protein deacetylase [Commensalibacter communis]CAI3937202.1 NAD-dependent protein deacetylase [Commensalibacter communis]CAI3938411.1 NAD-dependent protein deacetylase [Commensalibacter communis]CAI3939671.1 NAD-dependent protein deacetylase [Commensalibacter communis]CAI3942986.1 NAD-dependent protein deacetylase [Commensalibacter communis]
MKKIVVLTGAGVSKESGLDTFRDANGIWAKYSMEEVCSPEGFQRNPQKLHEFYNELRQELPNVQPNQAHIALAELEQAIYQNQIDAELLVITQNIDDLHERAGSQHLYHMHGELYKLWCTACDAKIDWHHDCSIDTPCPYCGQHKLRPDIVWFGEMPYDMEEIQSALLSCDLFVSIGTSGVVYPAAGFVQMASSGHAKTIELNLEPSAGTSLFDESRLGPATQLVPQFVQQILAKEI